MDDDVTKLYDRGSLYPRKAAPPEPDAVKRVGRYELKEKLGEGAVAAVYKAFDPKIDRTLAIKLLNPSFCQQPEHRARFVRESKGAGLLSHPNIVTVFDVGEDGEQPYIAMELVEGITLAEYLKEHKALPIKDVIDIGIQLAKALGYAHKRGIVHRDIKPGNVMIVRGTTSIKVADFGICRIEDNEATQSTRVGDVLGTPYYMSPEQVLGQRVDARADLFAAGVVLYEMFTGVRPFQAETLVTVAIKIVKEEPEAIDRRRPDLPLRLRRIIERCLRKEPDKRYQSGDELAADLIAVAQESKQDVIEARYKGLSLGVRWAAMAGSAVLVTMLICVYFVQHYQYAAMMRQVIGYGATLTKSMAMQGSETILNALPDENDKASGAEPDYSALEPLIQRAMNRQDFGYLRFVDQKDTVIGSSVSNETRRTRVVANGTPVSSDEEGVAVLRQTAEDGRTVLDFATPVTYAGKPLGATVHLGIYEAPLTRVGHLTLTLLVLLMAVTTLAVGAIAYVLARYVSGPIRILRNSLGELAKGHYDYRIKDQRNDELGDLYLAFDRAAESLQQRHEPAPPVPPTP